MSSALDRLPPLATSGVGSLPFSGVAAAVRHAARAYDVPFCPQLPRLEGDMVEEWLGSDPARCGWSSERDRERPAAWEAFVRELTERPPDHGVVKLQVTGPVTLGAALERSVGRPGCGPGVVGLAKEIADWQAANVRAQVARLRELGLDALLVVDEPGLAGAGLSEAHGGVWDSLRSLGGAFGVHVCGVVPWRLIDAMAPEVLSFDVVRFALEGEAREVLARLLGPGGRVAWGVVDPVAPAVPAAAVARVTAGLDAMAGRGLAVDLVAAQSVITPSCGSGRLSVSSEQLTAAVLRATRSVLTGNTPTGERAKDPAAH